jgi:uncharacterized protein
MDLSSAYVFNAPVPRVWDLLMDTEVIAACVPGCRGLRPLGNDRYEAELAVTVAAISGNFKGAVAIEDRVPHESYKLIVEGSGRPGFIKGHALVRLTAEGDATAVHVDAHADVGGMIARVGQRLLDSVGRTMMDRFYSCLAKQAERRE